MSELTNTDITVPAEVADANAEQAAQRSKEGGLAKGTLVQYRRRFKRFEEWCERAGRQALPATTETAAAYLNWLSEERELSAGTLSNYAAAISWMHSAEGAPDPTSTEPFQRFMRNRKRDGRRSTSSVAALRLPELKSMVKTCEGSTLVGARDKALLLVGFAGALRRSELSAIDRRHLDPRPGGYLLEVPAQKNDPEGGGQIKGIPETGTQTSPAGALSDYLEALEEALSETGQAPSHGAVFRSLGRWGHPRGRLSPDGVRLVVKRRCRKARLDEERYSAHSLRKGFMTEADAEGVTLSDIMAQSGHKDEGVALSYIEAGQALENPALQSLDL